jgi:hypothetical protein
MHREQKEGRQDGASESKPEAQPTLKDDSNRERQTKG